MSLLILGLLFLILAAVGPFQSDFAPHVLNFLGAMCVVVVVGILPVLVFIRIVTKFVSGDTKGKL